MGYIYVAEDYPEWVKHVMSVLREQYRKETNDFHPDFKKIASVEIRKKTDKKLHKDMGKMMGFVAIIEDKVKASGEKALSLEIPFNEKEFLLGQKEFIRTQLNLETLEIFSSTENNAPDPEKKKDTATPSSPSFSVK